MFPPFEGSQGDPRDATVTRGINTSSTLCYFKHMIGGGGGRGGPWRHADKLTSSFWLNAVFLLHFSRPLLPICA